MRLHSHPGTYLYLAFLGVLAVVLFACQTTASGRVGSAQRELGGLGPQVSALIRKYEAGVDRAIERCDALDLQTPKERKNCLGEFAPDSDLSKAIFDIQVYYDISAEALRELEMSLQVAELWLERSF